MSLRILFAPVGSEGDVNPLIWLAREAAARGHQPTLWITPHYGRLADAHGLPWVPIGSEEQFLSLARDPDLWHAQRGPRTVFKGMAAAFPHFLTTYRQAGFDFDLVVTSSLGFAVAALAEVRHIPRVTVHLQPICLRSVNDCPLFLEEMDWLRRAPAWVKRLVFAGTDLTVWQAAQRPLNEFRRQLGLPPIRKFYDQALHGGDGVAALFPEWFAAAQPDWPPRARQFGFPLSHDRRPLPPEVEAFLQAGDPPLVWTHGSANFDMRHFQKCAIRASQAIGQRCLLVSLDSPAAALPEGVFHARHVRFGDLFPRCALAIHHGGIGTTSKAIAAGLPQVIIPRSHDQPDNARRIEELRLGRHLRYRDLDGPKLEKTLRGLLVDEVVEARCEVYAERLQKENPGPEFWAWAEKIAGTEDASGPLLTTIL